MCKKKKKKEREFLAATSKKQLLTGVSIIVFKSSPIYENAVETEYKFCFRIFTKRVHSGNGCAIASEYTQSPAICSRKTWNKGKKQMKDKADIEI